VLWLRLADEVAASLITKKLPMTTKVGLDNCVISDPDMWARYQNELGKTLVELIDLNGDNKRLEEALNAYESAQQQWTRAQNPIGWGRIQNNTGNVLRRIAQRDHGTACSKEAVEAYRDALKVLTPEAASKWHVIAQRNLDACLDALKH
jgi:hypothetical protein